MHNLLTVGYSGHDKESFLALLIDCKVEVICDVRSTPYSRYKPDFSRQPLKQALNQAGIKYVFLGAELGARPADRNCYEGGQATYERIAKSAPFAAGLERIRDGSEKMNLALMCSERDPIECHRAILVCRELRDMRDRIHHLHGDGSSETQSELEDRLVGFFGLAPPPLLSEPGDWENAVAQAFVKQGDSIAYREKDPWQSEVDDD